MTAFFTLIRWKNIGLTAVFQYVLYFYLILPSLKSLDLIPQLDLHLLIVFIFCTICVVSSGHIIHYLSDKDRDKTGMPEGPLISVKISVKTGWIFYYSLVTAGFTAALYVAWKTGNAQLAGIYMGMQVLMYVYSRIFKHKGLPGSINAAISVAYVSLIMLWSDPEIISNPLLQNCKIITGGFSLFAFLINLSRELVKDIENLEDHKVSGLSTLPVTPDIAFKKYVSSISLSLLVLFLIIWVSVNKNLDFRMQVFPLVILAGPIILSIFRIYKAELKIHYTKISKLLNYIMISGLIYLLLIIQHNNF
jgi:4-hydroxybenzoate polyprenyltransferase